MTGPGFEEAAARVRAALRARPAVPLRIEGFRPAAVLVPILNRPGGPTLLFTLRTEDVPHHKGEISFPGGGRETGERAEAAALREALEEVGLEPGRVEVLGEMDDLPSVWRYVVTPVAAAIADPPATFHAQPGEVVEPFEVPLAALLAPRVRRAEWFEPSRLPSDVARAILDVRSAREDVDPATGRYRVWFFDASPDRVVWGLTGRILAELLDRVFPAGLAPGPPGG
ncbi:MAG TPA: CoA pyrophosphatase [Anaeromyxobacteraceae bacterium]|nr:CoA pyrophosphatase [Anaeromyxobacteraceae bacterium]